MSKSAGSLARGGVKKNFRNTSLQKWSGRERDANGTPGAIARGVSDEESGDVGRAGLLRFARDDAPAGRAACSRVKENFWNASLQKWSGGVN
jgi:hypothetical protein